MPVGLRDPGPETCLRVGASERDGVGTGAPPTRTVVLSHGVRLALEAEAPSLLEECVRAAPPGSRRCSGMDADVRVTLSGPFDVDRARGWRVLRDGVPVAPAAVLPAALALLESCARTAVAQRCPDRVFVHAGAVARRGRAIVLPGPSGAGKSTLVAALVRLGARYLSDEYAVLDRHGRVHPFPKPLTLWPAASGPREDVPVEALGGRRARGPVRLGLVAGTEYRAGSRWSAGRRSLADGLLALLEHAVPARVRPGFTMDVLCRTVAGAVVLTGVRGEAGEAAAAIMRCIDNLERGGRGAAESET